ncbi:HigA family addiction module antitoxin [Taklimakanibacter deserti]|uniref:HigA family addiction module antitoxin n=1 Tax=Taklimakanibacter deserti TaxID=2267839 RepID=UPI000E65BD2C
MTQSRKPTHPGAILREDVLPALKISVSDAAEKLLISRQTLHKILAEKGPITPEMAVRIGKLCGNGPDLWLGMQQAVDLWEAQQKLAKEVEKIPTLETA